MPAQKHFIGKILLDLTLQKEAGHFDEQQRWANILKKYVAPALSETFDKRVPSGEIWRIEKLTIDLGSLDEKTGDREIAEKIVGQVIALFEKVGQPGNKQVEKIPVEMAELEILLFFLKNGHLPEGALTMDVVAVFRKNISSNLDGLVSALTREFGNNEALSEFVAKRLAWQFPAKILSQFLEQFFSKNTSEELAWLNVIYEKIKTGKSGISKRLKEVFWTAFFRTFIVKTPDSTDFLEIFHQYFSIEKNNEGQGFEKIDKSILKAMDQGISSSKKGTTKREIRQYETVKIKSTETLHSIFCENAGVVLMHPFLPRFFQTIGLLAEDAKSFGSEEKREQGIHWLHYLATGQLEAKEHDLVFMKFLCGKKLAEPIRQIRLLEKGQIAEADAMLKAAIGHWAVLKNTSPDGLREGFLRRQGRLTKKPNGHLLEMENNTQDILLNQLPWGLSVVHFPWMEAPLWVHWT